MRKIVDHLVYIGVVKDSIKSKKAKAKQIRATANILSEVFFNGEG